MVESAYLEGLNDNRFPNRLSGWLGRCTGNTGKTGKMAGSTSVDASTSSVSPVGHSKTDAEDVARNVARTIASGRQLSINPSDHTRVSTSPQSPPSHLSDPDCF